jgi:hypothetical protein
MNDIRYNRTCFAAGFGWIWVDSAGFGGIRRDWAGFGWIRLDSGGYCGIRRDSAGFGWIRRDSAGFCGIRLDSAGFGWIRLDSAGFGWIRLDSAGFGGIRVDSGIAVVSVPAISSFALVASGRAVFVVASMLARHAPNCCTVFK